MKPTYKKVISYIKSKTESEGGVLADAVYRKFVKGKKKNLYSKLLTDVLERLEKDGLIAKDDEMFYYNDDFPSFGVLKKDKHNRFYVEVSYKGKSFPVYITRSKYVDFEEGDLLEFSIINRKRGKLIARPLYVLRTIKNREIGEVIEERFNFYIIKTISEKMPKLVIANKYDGLHIQKGDIVVVGFEEASRLNRDIIFLFRKSIPFYIGKVLEKLDKDRKDFHYLITKEKYELLEYGDEVKKEERRIKRRYKEWLKDMFSDGSEDLRDLFTVTIDGEDAKDFDDAISVERKGDDWILWVHIADVSHWVEKDSFLDIEAYKRGTSVYLVEHVVPMLPKVLSENVCSLREGEPRKCITTKMVFDKRFNIKEVDFFRSVIQVNKRLTYEYAERVLDGEVDDEYIYPFIKDAWELAAGLNRKRVVEGTIDLNIPEAYFVVEDGKIKDIEFSRRLKTHRIIEEFMLACNREVARYIEDMDYPSIYRIHEPMDEEKLLLFKRIALRMGYKFGGGKNIYRVIERFLESIAGKKEEKILNYLFLRSMKIAEYYPEPRGHFGLGFQYYTHFTSPIRRYPDLIVHRVLKAILDRKKPPYKKKHLFKIAEHSSEQERNAVSAERFYHKLKAAEYMEDKIGRLYEGIIVGFGKNSFFVELTDKPIEGRVALHSIKDDFYIVLEDRQIVVGKRNKRTFGIGDNVLVKVVGVDTVSGYIDFELVEG